MRSWKKIARIAVLALSLTAVAVPAAIAQDDVRTTQVQDDDFDWGWIGLLGLIGLAGLMRRDRVDRVDRGVRTPDRSRP